MKKLITIALMLPLFAMGQKYEYSAINSAGMNIKLKGVISINDSTTTIVVDNKGETNYQTVKKVNGMVYFTDGVMTHYFTFFDRSGSAKGVKYSKLMFLNLDARQDKGQKLMYYVNEIK